MIFVWGKGKRNQFCAGVSFAAQKKYFTPASFCFAKEVFYPCVLLLRKRDTGVK